MVFTRRFSATRFWKLVDLYRPTFLFTLSPIVNILLGRPESLPEKRHNLRVIIALGAARGRPIIEERFGAPVIDWYGMTEAGLGTYTRLDEARKPGSAGRRFPDSTMTILQEDGTVAAPGEEGEVVFGRGTISFDGYLKDDEATAAVIDADWFHTGDLGYFDEEGYFFFVDRKKDIVRRGARTSRPSRSKGSCGSTPTWPTPPSWGSPTPSWASGWSPLSCLPRSTPSPTSPPSRATSASTWPSSRCPRRSSWSTSFPEPRPGKIIKAKLRSRIPATDGGEEGTDR